VTRLMSVALTEEQVRSRAKTVTRRLGWRYLRVGERVCLCRKVMGRRPGEPLVRITTVEIVDVRVEPLSAVTDDDVAREGFCGKSAAWFVDFFTSHMRATADTAVTRIQWRYLDPPTVTPEPDPPQIPGPAEPGALRSRRRERTGTQLALPFPTVEVPR
jgi:hypothetical protein